MAQIASISELLETLGDLDLLERVDRPSDPALEIAEVYQASCRQPPKTCLFTQIRGCNMPIAAGLLRSPRHIATALGEERIEAIQERVDSVLAGSSSEGWYEKLLAGSGHGGLAKYAPRTVRSAASQQIVRLGSDVDLRRLPALRSRLHEPAPVITAGVVAVGGLAAGRAGTIGRYDLVVLDRDRLAPVWQSDDAAALLIREHAATDQAAPLTISLGGPPALLLAAMAPLDAHWDRWSVAGLLRGRAIDLAQARTVDLQIPADADLVIEGVLEPQQGQRWVGPVADALGDYHPVRPRPVFKITALTHRVNPVFPAMVPGPESGEAAHVARALHRMFHKMICQSIPGLIDFDLPEFGGAEAWAALAIDKQYPHHPQRVAQAAWAVAPFRRCRYLLIVDADVDVRDTAQLGAALTRHAAPGRDTVVDTHVAAEDRCAPRGQDDAVDRRAMRMLIDATWKAPDHGVHGGVWKH